jgi:nicotinamidase-related amidase
MEQNNNKTALLVMDVQGTIVKNLADSSGLLLNVSNAIKKARTNKIPVIYIVVGFRKGYPEVSANNKGFTALKSGGRVLDNEEAYQVDPSIAPEAGDVTIVKKRVSAFTGSDLEVVLRSMGIKHIVLSGIATSGVVLSTLREAADKDYEITVIADCCADGDEEIHRVLTTKVFPRQANVVTLQQWC